MVNQNENENEFFLVLGPYNQNELRFGDFRRSYQNELRFGFGFGYHKERPDKSKAGEIRQNMGMLEQSPNRTQLCVGCSRVEWHAVKHDFSQPKPML